MTSLVHLGAPLCLANAFPVVLVGLVDLITGSTRVINGRNCHHHRELSCAHPFIHACRPGPKVTPGIMALISFFELCVFIQG